MLPSNRFALFATVAAAAWVCPVFGQATPAPSPAQAPSEETSQTDVAAPEDPAVSTEQIAKLIEQLDANRFSQRQDATEKLVQCGRPAIAPLAEAAAGESREVTVRALDVLGRLFGASDEQTQADAKAALQKIAKGDHAVASREARELLKPKPTLAEEPDDVFPGPQIQIGGGPIRIGGQGQIQLRFQIGGAGAKRITSKNVNGVKDIDVEENGRKIKIHDDPNKGITVEITEKKDDKETTKKFEAKNADELKKKHPDAYKVYKEYAKGAGVGGILQIRGIQIGAGAIPAIPQILPRKIEIKKPAAEVPADSRKTLEEEIAQLEKQLEETRAKLKQKTKELDKLKREDASDENPKESSTEPADPEQ